jgi:hypothetical protein
MVIFSVTRCKHHLIFRTPLRAVAGTLAHFFLDQLRLRVAVPRQGGGVSTSTACSVAVIKVHQPKLLSLDLDLATTTYQPHGSSTFWSTPFIFSVRYRAITYMLCAIGQCGAGISIWHDHVHTNKNGSRYERTSGFEKLP